MLVRTMMNLLSMSNQKAAPRDIAQAVINHPTGTPARRCSTSVLRALRDVPTDRQALQRNVGRQIGLALAGIELAFEQATDHAVIIHFFNKRGPIWVVQKFAEARDPPRGSSGSAQSVR